jgi:hypothetical protein
MYTDVSTVVFIIIYYTQVCFIIIKTNTDTLVCIFSLFYIYYCCVDGPIYYTVQHTTGCMP